MDTTPVAYPPGNFQRPTFNFQRGAYGVPLRYSMITVIPLVMSLERRMTSQLATRMHP